MTATINTEELQKILEEPSPTVQALLELVTQEVVCGEMDRDLASAVGSALNLEHSARRTLAAEVIRLRAQVDAADALAAAARGVDGFMRTEKSYERSSYGPKMRAALSAYKATKC